MMEEFKSSLKARRRDKFVGEQDFSWESSKYPMYLRFVPLTDYTSSVFR